MRDTTKEKCTTVDDVQEYMVNTINDYRGVSSHQMFFGGMLNHGDKFYNDHYTSKEEIREIIKYFASRALPIYTKDIVFNADQRLEILIGYYYELDITKYDKPEFSWLQMMAMRMTLKQAQIYDIVESLDYLGLFNRPYVHNARSKIFKH